MRMKSIDRVISEDMSTTLRLSNELKRKLVKIGARLSLKDGKDRTMQDIVEYLVEEHDKTHKEGSSKE